MVDPVLGDLDPAQVRVRFPPSPTGNLHVGNVRSALFNWVFARHFDGTFVLRVEDTDVARNDEASYVGLLEALRWLGLGWDEGPEVGGPHGPYRQSERYETYADVTKRLLDGGHAYHCYCSPAELDQRRERSRAEGLPPGYDGHCRRLTDSQVATYRREGREPVVRFRVPDGPIEFTDLVRGDIRFESAHVPDYVLVRSNGHPLYPLVNPVDDALMGITHVLRGEDLLSSTPRQIVLYAALAEVGAASGPMPRFGHLPFVMGEGNRKLSKREPESSLDMYRHRGFLPEGLLNYLALLGWAIAEDRELFSLTEMVQAFDIRRVNPNPARFDLRKCEAVNAAHVRMLAAADLADRLVPYLQVEGLLPPEPTDDQLGLVAAAAPLVQERITVLGDAVGMLAFLFVPENRFVVDADAAAWAFDDAGLKAAAAAQSALGDIDGWRSVEIEAALRRALVEELGLKPRHAFGPVRVAVTGRRVSPPLFESLELIGRERTLARLAAVGGSS